MPKVVKVHLTGKLSGWATATQSTRPVRLASKPTAPQRLSVR